MQDIIIKDGKLTDAATGKAVRFEALEVPGRGWTVAKVIGSKSTGRKIERLADFRDTYSMHQAQVAAANVQRDAFAFISGLTDGQAA